MSNTYELTGAQVLTPDGVQRTSLAVQAGLICDAPAGRKVDLSGFMVLPGIVDIHGDGFERHLAPRRGAMKDMRTGLIAAEAELAANGITTATLAQFYSWEGGMRGPEFATSVLEALQEVRPQVQTDLRTQLRFEISMVDDYADFQKLVATYDVPYVVFNDHLPHDALEKGKRPPRLTGQALRIGRNPEKHLEFMHALHARMDQVPPALDQLCADLKAAGVCMGSHDETTPSDRATWRGRGVQICEFPLSSDVAQEAQDAVEPVIMGAPNVVRGGSHNGNVSAADLVAMGLCSALASDYHYPSLRRAAFFLTDCGLCDLGQAWQMISFAPAQILGLTDRGRLTAGQRADMVVIDAETRAVQATICAGRFSYLTGEAADRFTAPE